MRKKVRLDSPFDTGHFYTTTVNTKATEKLAKSMYDPVVRKHGVYKESKLK